MMAREGHTLRELSWRIQHHKTGIMDKQDKPRRNTGARTGSQGTPVRRNSEGEPIDADTYNPVGMAGEKAGIVKRIEEQLRAEDGKPRRKARRGARK